MKKKVTIIDYGAGNILSVFRAFEACSVTTEVITDVNKAYDEYKMNDIIELIVLPKNLIEPIKPSLKSW